MQSSFARNATSPGLETGCVFQSHLPRSSTGAPGKPRRRKKSRARCRARTSVTSASEAAASPQTFPPPETEPGARFTASPPPTTPPPRAFAAAIAARTAAAGSGAGAGSAEPGESDVFRFFAARAVVTRASSAADGRTSASARLNAETCLRGKERSSTRFRGGFDSHVSFSRSRDDRSVGRVRPQSSRATRGGSRRDKRTSDGKRVCRLGTASGFRDRTPGCSPCRQSPGRCPAASRYALRRRRPCPAP